MTVEIGQSGKSKRVITGVVTTVLRSLVDIGAAIAFFRARSPASVGTRSESAAVETERVATTQIPDDAEGEADADADGELSQQEIERRRSLVRARFNDFWRGTQDKPAGFVARLDQAEDYLNERLKAHGEVWQLDARTRLRLGLPPRSS
ncbi:MAG TPA: hypothetical protein VKG24_27795 [Pseudolabrys sp.]|nr:hypothetical protein [Pseudolabrys sp.]